MNICNETTPAYSLVEEAIEGLLPSARVEQVVKDSSRSVYVFDVSSNGRKARLTFSEEFLNDLRDSPQSGKYWEKLHGALKEILITSFEGKGLFEYSRRKLKELIFDHIKQALKTCQHVNKYNLLGREYSQGALERYLGVRFTAQERVNAGMAFDEMQREGVIVPTYKDLVAPGDWVALRNGATPKAEALENKEEEIIEIGDLQRAKNIPIKEVFVSSTVEDLIDLRAEIVAVLEEKGIKAVHSGAPDFAGLTPDNACDICLARVQNTPILVTFIDKRYGSLYTGKHEAYKGLSVTHAEYRQARATNKLVLVYIRQEVFQEYDFWKSNPSAKCKTEAKILQMVKEIDGEDVWIDKFINSVELKIKLIKRLRVD